MLIMGEREEISTFRREIGCYVLPEPKEEDERLPNFRSTHEIPSNEKGKQHVHEE